MLVVIGMLKTEKNETDISIVLYIQNDICTELKQTMSHLKAPETQTLSPKQENIFSL